MVMHVVTGILLLAVCSQARDITFTNNLDYSIWVGLQPGSGHEVIAGGGWQMDPDQTVVQSFPDGWEGRFWGRTGCGNGPCQTGDCGNGQLECNGAGGEPPATLAEIRFNGDQNQDFYDVSLVDGFNIGVEMAPTDKQGTGDPKVCTVAGCTANVNANCPADLQQTDDAGNVVACWSSCARTHSDADCCTGPNSQPDTCQPSESTQYFKQLCPDAYSYAYDDPASLKACSDTNYRVTFVST